MVLARRPLRTLPLNFFLVTTYKSFLVYTGRRTLTFIHIKAFCFLLGFFKRCISH